MRWDGISFPGRNIGLILATLGLTFLWSSCAVRQGMTGAHRWTSPVEKFRRQIDRLLQDAALQQTRAGIKIVSLKTGEVLYERNSHTLFHPASNMKLLTTAAALKYLGPNYRFRTVLFADSGSIHEATIQGNIYLKGYGNPDLTGAHLQEMIRQLKRKGIRRITGNLICDDTFFDDLYWGKGWMWDDASSWYFAPISALSVNDNCVRVYVAPGEKPGDPLRVEVVPATAYVTVENHGRTIVPEDTQTFRSFKVERKWKSAENTIVVQGGLPPGVGIQEFLIDVVDAPLYAGTLFRELLQQDGIEFTGRVLKGKTPTNALPVVQHRSPPLALVVYNTNKISDNLSAEMLLKTLAAERKGVPGTAEKGLTIIRDYLDRLGVDSSTYEIVDGSGVSRYNLITPDLMVELLTDMYRDFQHRAEFIASLPIAGVDGTLSDRMRGTPAEGVLRAKTGSLSGVSALAGYTISADGEVLAFSILMEHFVGSADRVRAVQDQIGSAMSAFSRKRTQRLPLTDRFSSSDER